MLSEGLSIGTMMSWAHLRSSWQVTAREVALPQRSRVVSLFVFCHKKVLPQSVHDVLSTPGNPTATAASQFVDGRRPDLRSHC